MSSWTKDSERRLHNTERALAKLVIHQFQRDESSVPEVFHGAVVDAITAQEILDEAKKREPR